MKGIVICRTESQLLSFLRRHGYRASYESWPDGGYSQYEIHRDGEKVFYSSLHVDEDGYGSPTQKLVCLFRPRKKYPVRVG